MDYYEFCDRIGYRVSEAIYADIEFVYLNDSRFVCVQDMVDYWNKYDYSGIHGIHGLKCAIIDAQNREKDIEEGRLVAKWDSRNRCIRMVKGAA